MVMTTQQACIRQAQRENLVPELIQALQRCYSDLQRFAPTSTGSEMARAVLAKATGDQS